MRDQTASSSCAMARMLFSGLRRAEKLPGITATVLFENRPMQKVFERLRQTGDAKSLEAELVL
jgi:hypothetical protein